MNLPQLKILVSFSLCLGHNAHLSYFASLHLGSALIDRLGWFALLDQFALTMINYCCYCYFF